jgi:hypothetical protein
MLGSIRNRPVFISSLHKFTKPMPWWKIVVGTVDIPCEPGMEIIIGEDLVTIFPVI